MDSCTAEVNVDVALMVDVTTRVQDTSGELATVTWDDGAEHALPASA